MEEESEFKKLPIEDRCVHKSWKARLNGYEEAAKLFRTIDDEKSPEWNKYLGLIKKFVTDSNVVAQEKGLEAALLFIENSGVAAKCCGEVVNGLVLKCLGVPKQKTKDLAVNCCLMFIEIEKHEIVMEELLKGMEQKNPKIVISCISTITLALQEFGSKVIPIKPLVKKIPIMLADRDKLVRDGGKAMVIEMYRWVGAALKPQLASLQPVQITELEAEFEKVRPGSASPTRYLRSQQQKQAKIAAEQAEVSDDEADAAGDPVESVDPFDLIDPVDILSKLPKDFYEKCEAKKWQERKEVLEALEQELVKSPKLESGEYGDLVRVLKKIIQKDATVMVVVLAAKCLGLLANGLKKRFATYAGFCMPVLLEKFREKKANVVQALRDAIDAVFISTNVENILEDVLESLNNKNPSVKSETASFLSRAFAKCQPIQLPKKLLKAYTVALLKTLSEPDPGVRDASAEALGTLMKLVGEKQMMPYLVDVEPIKMNKIKECCEKAVVKVVAPPKKERPSSAPAAKVGTSAAGKTVKRPVTATKTSGAATKSAGKKTTGGAPKVVAERDMSQEEVDEKILEYLPSDVVSGLSNMNWKTRLSSMERFNEIVAGGIEGDVSTQTLVKTLIKKPGLKDTNFQVLRIKLETIKNAAENYTFSMITASACLPDIVDKLSDVKNGQLAAQVLTAIAEATKFEAVSSEVLNLAFEQKSPKVKQETLLWLVGAIQEFGLTLNLKFLVECIKKALATSTPEVRTAAVTLIGTIYLYKGESIVNVFSDEKSAIKSQIELECQNRKNEQPPKPSRGATSAPALKKEASQNSDEEETSEPNDEELITKVDITSQITESLLNELSDKNWKVRMEALTKILNILTENKSISASNLTDLVMALAPRLTDSNSKIAQTTIQVCEALVKAVGSSAKQYVRNLFPGFVQGLGDSKTWIRSGAVTCINVWGDICGYKEFFDGEMIFDALKTGSPTLRTELWAWLTEKLPPIKLKTIPKEELVICVPLLYLNLEDRNADVRKNAQDAVLPFMLHLGYESMLKQSEKLKPGSKTVIVAALDKARPSLPVKPLPSKAPPSKVVKSGGAAKAAAGSGGLKTSNSKTKIGSRPSTTTGTSKSKKDEDVDLSPLLAINNLKLQRSLDEQLLKCLKWNFSQPREEFVDLLREQMSTAGVNKTLMANMFHADFRYHLKAIESLTEDLNENFDALLANLDLVLKWLTLRFFDTNPSVLLKGLEYLQTVFGLLVENEHNLTDNEASSFIPYLILKVGDSKDAVRNAVRALFKQISFIYSVPKLFSYIIDGLKIKNARLRTECLEELSCIIEEFGTVVVNAQSTQSLREIAKQISDRDNSVRNAALNCIVQAYRLQGEKIYKQIGNISDKDLSLLEERIKRAAKQVKVAPPPRVSVAPMKKPVEPEPEPEEEEPEPIPILPPVVPRMDRSPVKGPQEIVQVPTGPFSLDYDLIARIESEPCKVIIPKIRQMDISFLNDDPPQFPSKQASVMPISPPKRITANDVLGMSFHQNNEQKQNVNSFSTNPTSNPRQTGTVLLRTLEEIRSTNLKIAIPALFVMSDAMRESEANMMTNFENDIMSAVLHQIKNIKTLSVTNPETMKAYRHCFSLLITFYENKVVGRNISREVLKEMLDESIKLLVCNQIASLPDAEPYIKVINVICLRLIDRSDQTSIICALIELLYNSSPPGSASPKYVDLVMKCLWKVVKLLPQWADELDYDSILLQIHLFFTDFPTSWWKQQVQDTPSRTVKTVIHAMCKNKGQPILQHFTKIPQPQTTELYFYIVKILKSLKVEDTRTVPMLKKDPVMNPLSKSTHNLLTEIFKKIGVKETSKEGLLLLYEFKEQHPEADVDPFLKRSSEFFQQYIKNGLDEIESQKRNRNIKKMTSDFNSNSGELDEVAALRRKLEQVKREYANGN